MIALDDTKTRIIFATMKAVRQHGLEGVRIQNVSDLAEISPGALYRYFDSKDQLIEACFTYVDKQAAAIFDHLTLNPISMLTDPMGAVKSLWLPYFRYWTSHPDETVFYHRFRDSAFFPKYDKTRDFTYFNTFIRMVHLFKRSSRPWTKSTRTSCGFMSSHPQFYTPNMWWRGFCPTARRPRTRCFSS